MTYNFEFCEFLLKEFPEETEPLGKLWLVLDLCLRFWPVVPKLPVTWKWLGWFEALTLLLMQALWHAVAAELVFNVVVVVVMPPVDNPHDIWIWLAAAAAAAFSRKLWALIAVSVAYWISRADTEDLKWKKVYNHEETTLYNYKLLIFPENTRTYMYIVVYIICIIISYIMFYQYFVLVTYII